MKILALGDDELAAIERTAVKLAEAAGATIRQALGGELTVRYKQFDDAEVLFRDPVSDVDERVEALIREEVGRQFRPMPCLAKKALKQAAAQSSGQSIRSTARQIS